MTSIRQSLYVTALVSRPRGSWRWQDRYAISTYGVRRTRDGRLILAFCARGCDIASVGRARRAPSVDVDAQGSLHQRPLRARHVRAMVRHVLAEVPGMTRARAARGLRLAQRIILARSSASTRAASAPGARIAN